MAQKSSNTAVRLILIIVAALVLFALITYYNRSRRATERYTSEPASATDMRPLLQRSSSKAEPRVPEASYSSSAPQATFEAMEPGENEMYRPVDDDGNMHPKDPFPQDRISPEELLPRDAANSKWSQVNPAGQGSVRDQNFLTAGYHMGVDTQGSSLRNASHDLRSEPANPRYKVSIWNSSSIEPDMHRKPLH